MAVGGMRRLSVEDADVLKTVLAVIRHVRASSMHHHASCISPQNWSGGLLKYLGIKKMM